MGRRLLTKRLLIGPSILAAAVIVGIAMMGSNGKAQAAAPASLPNVTPSVLANAHIQIGTATSEPSISKDAAGEAAVNLLDTPVLASTLASCTLPDDTVVPACWEISLTPHEIESGYLAGVSKPVTAMSSVELALVDASTGKVVFAAETTEK
jgi:hypothetical protein